MATRVLVVDDSNMSRQAVRRILAPAGFDVVEAVDGIDALAKLRGYPDIALVVSDVNMPRMNGLELLQSIQADASYGDVAVIIMSVADALEPFQRARGFGAKGWLKKPVSP